MPRRVASGNRIREASAEALPGARVVLRHPRPADAPAFLAMVARSRRLHRPWVYPPADAPGFLAYVKRSRADRQAGFLAILAESRTIVGAVNISEMVRGNFRSAYLGFYGSAGFERQGLMSEAVSLALDHAFGELELHRIEANVQPGNTNSRALVERCGFRLEGFSPRYLKIGGRWRDHERWAILAEDWRMSRRRRPR